MSAHSLVSSRMHIVALHVSVLYCGKHTMYVPGIATCLYLELGCDCSVLHVHTVFMYIHIYIGYGVSCLCFEGGDAEVIVVNKKGYIGMP